MWVSFLLNHGSLREMGDIASFKLTIQVSSLVERNALIVHVYEYEDVAYQIAYTALLCTLTQLDWTTHTGILDLAHQQHDLTDAEQQVIRTWLIDRSWPAWARAHPSVRSLLGVPGDPLLLAEATRQLGIPLITLAKAAQREHLPTIRAGDRQLVYLSTIHEAQMRGLLHHRPGRPPARRDLRTKS